MSIKAAGDRQVNRIRYIRHIGTAPNEDKEESSNVAGKAELYFSSISHKYGQCNQEKINGAAKAYKIRSRRSHRHSFSNFFSKALIGMR